MTLNRILSGIAIVCLQLAPLVVSGHAADALFPRYAEIEPNIKFWTDIYARYTTTQAVVHDSVHLDVVYAVIDLKPADEAGARKENRRRMKAAAHQYARLLAALAADPAADDAECRRVAELFGPAANARTFRQARHRVRCQIGQRDRFRGGMIRSGAYIDRMREILALYGVPADLAYLPHVESSFDIGVTSKSGAAGMWQFTRSTGRRFLVVNDVRDERRDPIAATHAAARLLKENFEKLGSWPLAITAYNHGAAGMQRAKAIHGDFPTVFANYRGRTFKFASRNFYAEFIAARQVASDYRNYFGELPLATPAPIRSITLDGYVAWADLCHHFKIAPRDARAMNPALRPPVFDGQKYVPKGYVFNLPVTDAWNRDGVIAAIPGEMLRDSQRPSRFYTVQPGDTAGRIARLHRVKLADLILANDLDRRATVYVRQKLRIPQKDGGIPTVDKTTRPVVVPAVSTALAAATDRDTLRDSIPSEGGRRRYRRPGPSPAELLAMVDVQADVAAETPVGFPGAAAPGTVTADVAIDRIVQTAVRPMGIITVEVEETLGHYAAWAGISATRLRRINHLPAGHELKLHQQIKIPLDKVSAERFEGRRHAFHKQLQADFFAAYRIGALQQYRVQPGDSYWTLCREKFDLPLWLLRHYNADVNLAALKIHQPLTIPAIISVARTDAGAGSGPQVPDA